MTSNDPKNIAKDIADRASDISGKAASSVKDVADKSAGHVRDFAARAGNAAGDIYDKTQDRVRETVDRVPEHAAHAMDAGRRAYDHSSKTVGRHLAKQPLEALLLAGAIGYLIGWATNRS